MEIENPFGCEINENLVRERFLKLEISTLYCNGLRPKVYFFGLHFLLSYF